MNIFFLDYDPKLCAAYHCDKHCVKMIIEYAQILSTAHRLHSANPEDLKRKKYTITYDDNVDTLLLKATHIGNRTVAWVMKSTANYIWLSEVLMYLSIEYTRRYGRKHKYTSNGLIDYLYLNTPKIFNFENITKRYLAKQVFFHEFNSIVEPESFQECNPIASYRNCYMNEKRYMVKYKLGNWPEWFV